MELHQQVQALKRFLNIKFYYFSGHRI